MKDKVHFESDDVTAWLTNNYNTHIAQYLILLIEHNKRNNSYFKNDAENETERVVPDLFLSFKRALYKVKARGLQLGFAKGTT